MVGTPALMGQCNQIVFMTYRAEVSQDDSDR